MGRVLKKKSLILIKDERVKKQVLIFQQFHLIVSNYFKKFFLKPRVDEKRSEKELGHQRAFSFSSQNKVRSIIINLVSFSEHHTQRQR